jgi:Tfp pilus assembly protein PilN
MVNLLPASYRRQQILRRRITEWCSIVAIVMLAGAIWHWYELREHRLLAQQLEMLSREHAPTQTMLKQVVQMRKQLEDLQHQEAVSKVLEHQRNALRLLGVISESAEKTHGKLRVTKLDLTDFQHLGPSAGPEVAGQPASGVVFSGVSLDNPAVAELLTGLKESGIFSRVELLSIKEREDKTASLHDYEVRCEF